MQFISFVIPCYNSEHTLGQVVAEIENTVSAEDNYEIILVNDCSKDGVWGVIKNLAKDKSNIVGINLASNFGQHAALMAGYRRAQGDIIVSLDDDGQSPVNEVYKLIDKLNEGYDVIYARYGKNRYDKKGSWLRKFGSMMSTWIARVMIHQPKDITGSSFFVMKRYIMDEVIQYKNPYPYMFGLVVRCTKNIENVCVTQRDRAYGHSGYNLKKLLSLWINEFTAFSVMPLRIADIAGVTFSILGFIAMLLIIIRKCLNPEVAIGWSSVMSLVLMVGGIILLILGLIGEYVGRIYICINNAPQYVIRETIGSAETRNIIFTEG